MRLSEYQKLASRTDLSDEQYPLMNINAWTFEGDRCATILLSIEDLAIELDPIKKFLLYKEAASPENCNTEDVVHMRDTHGIMGILTEIPELLDACRKDDKVNVGEELADILWYVALIANNHGLDMDKLASANIDKLKARFPNKFTTEDALHRNLGTERAILEEGIPLNEKSCL